MVIVLMMKIINIRNKKMGKYHDLYLKIDGLFLAEVFQKFKNIRTEIMDWILAITSAVLHYIRRGCFK